MHACSVISPASVGVQQTHKINIQRLLTGQEDRMSGQFGTSAKVSYAHFGTGAEVSWVRSVRGPKCLRSEVSWVQSVCTPTSAPRQFGTKTLVPKCPDTLAPVIFGAELSWCRSVRLPDEHPDRNSYGDRTIT